MKNLLPIFAILLTACASDDDNASTTPPSPDAKLVYVANEGNFGQGTASLTLYNATDNTVSHDLYAQANGEPLGDILQSVYLHNDELYLVVNNSEKIEVCDPFTIARKRTIVMSNSSPRYMHFLHDEKAYVTDFFAGGIHIVNPTLGTYLGFISSGGWTENMIAVNGEVWVTNPGSNVVYVIDTATDNVVQQVELTDGPNTLVHDANGDVWVMCNGSFTNPNSYTALHRIDAQSKSITASFDIAPDDDYSATVRSTPDRQHLLYIRSGEVYRMHMEATALPSEPFIAAGNRNFYGFHVNATTGAIALTDAADFQSAGQVYLYGSDGAQIISFTGALIPGFVAWGN